MAKKADLSPSEALIEIIKYYVIHPRENELQRHYSAIFTEVFRLLGSVEAITYRGSVLKPNPLIRPTTAPAAPPELHEELDKYLLAVHQMDRDWHDIRQCLSSVLALGTTGEDYRNYLPDTLIAKMKVNNSNTYLDKPRTVPLEEMPIPSRFLRKTYFETVIPKIDYYLAIQFLM